jgi:cell division septal protein FtsQ
MSQQNQKKQLRHRKKKQSLPLILFFAGGLLLVIGAVFAFKKPAEPNAAIEITGAPSLKVDQEKVDLGNIKLGRTVDVKFKLTNVGDETLRFSKTPFIEVLEGC